MSYSEKAKSRFLESNQDLREKLANIPDARANALGISKEELQDLDLLQAMEIAAENHGQDFGEFMIDLGTDSVGEATQIRLHQAKRRADALGLTWEQFVELNPHWNGYN